MSKKYLVGIFDDEEPLLEAVRKVKEKGYVIHDVFTPFPVHGLEKVLEMKETRLHTVGFIAGATGTMTALGFMTWVTNISWPINVGGKPDFSLLAFVPISFELTVLFAGVTMTVVYYLRNSLSVFKDDEVIDPRTTDHKFAMVFDMDRYNSIEKRNSIDQLLMSQGASEVYIREMNKKIPSMDEQSL